MSCRRNQISLVRQLRFIFMKQLIPISDSLSESAETIWGTNSFIRQLNVVSRQSIVELFVAFEFILDSQYEP